MKKVDILADNSEHIKTMTVNDAVFLDSYLFLSNSLDSLGKSLGDINEYNFDIVFTYFKSKGMYSQMDDKIPQLCQKGIFPYEYISDFKVLRETVLPNREAFFSN